MPQLVRNTKDGRKDLISLADALRECSRGKRHFSSNNEKLCNGGGAGRRPSPSSPRAMVFVFYYSSPMLEGAILLAVVMHPR